MEQAEDKKVIFYKKKWFKLVLLCSFYGFAILCALQQTEIDENNLETLEITVKKSYTSGKKNDPIKIYFDTKEYSNPFGIEVGGIYKRMTRVEKALEIDMTVIIKIQKNKINQLNQTNEAILIYYLSNEEGVIFNENDFNEGEKKSANIYLIVLMIGFIVFLWIILRS